MEFFVANLSGHVRSATWNGRKYLVALATSIVPGVLNGSNGALFYPPGEISRNVQDWNDQPVVVYHPFDRMGNPVSARHQDAQRQIVGVLRNSRLGKGGKLLHEVWFDKSRTRACDPRVYNALLRGDRMEISTGLYTENEEAEPGSNYNGKPYSHIARQYKPDHLAILPDQVGACSLNDGCGLMVNQQKPPPRPPSKPQCPT